jgi:acyl carrier protein
VNDTEARLIKCFSAVFPGLGENEIRHASPYTVAAWDSVATLNLLLLVGEEFGVEFGETELERLATFQEILDFVSSTSAASATGS